MHQIKKYNNEKHCNNINNENNNNNNNNSSSSSNRISTPAKTTIAQKTSKEEREIY
jgi:hypothetical protein